MDFFAHLSTTCLSLMKSSINTIDRSIFTLRCIGSVILKIFIRLLDRSFDEWTLGILLQGSSETQDAQVVVDYDAYYSCKSQ